MNDQVTTQPATELEEIPEFLKRADAEDVKTVQTEAERNDTAPEVKPEDVK